MKVTMNQKRNLRNLPDCTVQMAKSLARKQQQNHFLSFMAFLLFIAKRTPFSPFHRRQSGVTFFIDATFNVIKCKMSGFGRRLTFENVPLFDLRVYYRANLQPKDVESRVPFCHD